MVDFKKRLKKKEIVKKVNPIDIYESLDRRSETGPLRGSQETILREWFETRFGDKNTIIKLHTGEGKTLIGLLILQSKINAGKGPALFVCPNIYLAEQVKQEANKFGIKYCDFSDGKDIPDEFLLGKSILITHVQKVFNGKTVFGIGNKSIDVNSIVLDDSHACIDSIKNSLTIKVDRDHELYKSVIEIFEDDIKAQGEGSFLEIKNGDYNTMLPIPYWSWEDKRDSVIEAIVRNKDKNEIAFVWPVIKDQIANCQAFISGNSLEITPSLMPIDAFGTFSKAEHRILMSATTQDDSFFIKGLGFDVKSVENPLTNNDLKWSGEKMVLIPSLIDESLDRDAVINWLVKPFAERQFGIVSLVPSFTRKQQYENIGAHVATTDDLFNSVQKLKNGFFSEAMVFANRYDGIDLPDNACRILILDSKPYFDSLLDRYEEDCRATSDIVNIKVAQKVEQGLGRSVRGEKDYSVILLLGGDLVKFAKSPITSKYFSPQTKKQIEIGMQVAEFAVEEKSDTDSYKTMVDLINQILQRDEGWKEYYSEEMDQLDDSNKVDKVYKALELEYKAEYNFSIGEYDLACQFAQKLCDEYSSDQLERGWYLQSMARYKYRTSKVDSNRFQKTAFQKNLQLLKPRDGVAYKKLEYINQNRISRIKNWISNHDCYESMMLAVEGMLQNLSFGMPSEKFESSLQELGEVIGFLSQRPDKEIGKGPDNLWCGVDDYFFLLECKNEVNEDRAEINKHEAAQMNSHCAWFESIYDNKPCKRILIIPTKKLSYHGDFTHDVEVMRKGSLNKLKNSVKGFFKEFAKLNIHQVDDQEIQKFIDTHNLDLDSLKDKFTEKYTKSNS
ncbi:DEAD/DEAH box helicase [Vibrio parahaemolyticus]|uniref:DEAD/DEAH box helicase n=5 Tax=Vibrio parahaemolyticus TaxID=670 RepID=UPI000991B498|nr:DEAD/DEAH box helicase family protein [Vibrio parahaemolyticus]EGQ9821669.1 DEAD/DEAH box helicase [Vibrio parahaemolyticus]OOQ71281.1 DEAD/DEAH box helicase [Vibrio parahaemolyticus]PMT78236.1 DEAD/DEAH box helicase [Vibrio parahaemolyticus]PMT82843.1 DEAD/DEAH box helicase [Vibrio parahaemolyticus]HAS6614228.1 DEAD/DEAH box helicase [Vibrio parahaemolyticus]